MIDLLLNSGAKSKAHSMEGFTALAVAMSAQQLQVWVRLRSTRRL
jgi:hypothetical protein